MTSRRPWLIVGCGYCGTHLARRLLGDGAEVVVTRRSQAGLDEVVERLGRHPQLRGAVAELGEAAAMVAEDSIVVLCAPPSDSNGQDERRFAEGCRAAGVYRLIYLSSTGVYPNSDGGWVDESVPARPSSEHGKRRAVAEQAILAGGGAVAVALRVAGIYGPGRGVHARLATGSYRVVGDGTTMVSRIHVDDLVSAIVTVGRAHVLGHEVYNVADDEPAPSSVVGDGVAEMMGLERPPRVSADSVSVMARAMLGANRRISNRRLSSELPWTPRYPSWREGTQALLADD